MNAASCLHSSALVLVLSLFLVLTANNNRQVLSINLSMIDIHNDMPSSVVVRGTFQETEVEITPGTSYDFIPEGSEKQVCSLILEREQLCAHCVVFDPSVDYKEHHIFWSVRDSGIHRSLDQANWEKKADWNTIATCKR